MHLGPRLPRDSEVYLCLVFLLAVGALGSDPLRGTPPWLVRTRLSLPVPTPRGPGRGPASLFPHITVGFLLLLSPSAPSPPSPSLLPLPFSSHNTRHTTDTAQHVTAHLQQHTHTHHTMHSTQHTTHVREHTQQIWQTVNATKRRLCRVLCGMRRAFGKPPPRSGRL